MSASCCLGLWDNMSACNIANKIAIMHEMEIHIFIYCMLMKCRTRDNADDVHYRRMSNDWIEEKPHSPAKVLLGIRSLRTCSIIFCGVFRNCCFLHFILETALRTNIILEQCVLPSFLTSSAYTCN